MHPPRPGRRPCSKPQSRVFPGRDQPYLPVTVPTAAPTASTAEPAAPASPASANFELETGAPHGRPEKDEPSGGSEDISPEPEGTEAAPTLGVALNVEAKSAFDDGQDDERQVVGRYALWLGAPHGPAAGAPASPETGTSSPPAALFLRLLTGRQWA